MRVKSLPEAEALPDLAVSSIDRSGAGLSVVVSNFGSADAPDVTIRLMGDGGAVLSEKTVGGIPSAKTYVPGEARINFPVTSGSSVRYRVIVDPENSIEEIYEGNNECLSVVK